MLSAALALPMQQPTDRVEPRLHDLHGETHDAYGALWLLEMRVHGTTSIWRTGQRIARLPWRPVAAALHRARSPGGAAAELIALLARQLDDRMPYAIADALGAQIAAWAESSWPALVLLAND